jgi:putative nucleotidyltransferase-like protein
MRIAKLTLALDETMVRVLRAFASAGVHNIVLKGPTLQRELHADGTLRPYTDADLLVAPSCLDAAGRALESLGLRLILDHREHRGIAEPHAQEWGRSDGVKLVDLHWRVAGVNASPERAWEVLSSHRTPFSLAGAPAECLDRPGMALLVGLHAGHHGTARRTPVADLGRALERFDRETWAAAAALAAELDASEAFAAGLRATSDGAVLARELGLAASISPERRLIASSPPPGAIGLLSAVRTPGAAARLHAIRNALVPSPAFMRAEYPHARSGPAGLAFAYVARLVVRVRMLPRAARAVRESLRGSARP